MPARTICIAICLLAIRGTAAQVCSPVVKAFPSAEGYGANAIGGRSPLGTVIEVTTCADGNPPPTGSLRAAIEAAGPRFVVFRTGGTITLTRSLIITNPFITIAGQTAPGGGIALKNDGSITFPLLQVATHDVIIRYIRTRPGPDNSPNGSCCLDALSLNGNVSPSQPVFNVVVDHVSASWSVDELMEIFGDVHDVTVQWSIFSEGLFCSNHQKSIVPGGSGECPTGGPSHSRGITISALPEAQASPTNMTLHHNLIAHADIRYPNFTTAGLLDFSNNVLYDYRTRLAKIAEKRTGMGLVVEVDFVGNFADPGPESPATTQHMIEVDNSNDPNFDASIYSQDNVANPPALASLRPADAAYEVFSPHTLAPIVLSTAAQAKADVLSDAGATLPVRDAVDTRIVGDVLDGNRGMFIDDPSEVGGWPVLDAGTPPVDSDHDGMPDAWETDHGLNPASSADAMATAPNGYANLENYVNELAGDIIPIIGDVNNDGQISLLDLPRFVTALIDPSMCQADLSVCDFPKADVNGDGFVDGGDIEGFVTLLLGCASAIP